MRILIAFLFAAVIGLAQTSGGGGVLYPTTSPAGKTCSGNAIIQVFGGVVYTCQGGIYVAAGGGGGTGTVTNVSAGALNPLFTSTVANPTTTPALTFTLSSGAANLIWATPNGASGVGSYRAAVGADIPAIDLSVFGSNGGVKNSLDYSHLANAPVLQYQTIDSNGTAVTQRPTVNFISGPNATVNCVDNSGATRTDCTVSATGGGGSGTVTNFSAGTLSPLFTTSVATSTTTPALSFALSNATANTVYGRPTGTTGAPSFYTPVFLAGTGIGITGTFGTTGLTITNSAPMTFPAAGLALSTGSAWGTPAASNVIGLWSGTCNGTTYLRGDGSCNAPSGSGTVNSGTANQLAYYASSGAAVSGITSTSVLDAANVLMFGVKGDCATGTETTETSTINAVMAAYSNVFFAPAPGTCYAINGQLLGKTGQTITGSGVASKIEQFSTTANGLAFIAASSGSRNIAVRNMYIQDQVRGTRTAGHGIDIDGTGDASIFNLYNNFIFGFENGENIVSSLNSNIVGDRSTSAIANAFSVTGLSTSTNFMGTYGDAPGNDCYEVGDLQYSTWSGTACDAATRDGYHFYFESGGRPKSITLNSPGNETSGRYGIYTEGQAFTINQPAISGIPTGSGHACIAINQSMQIDVQGGQCTGGDYVVNILGDPSFLPLNFQGTNRVQDIYYASQGVGFSNDTNGYLNVSLSRRNFAGAVPVSQLHEVTTPMMLANVLTITGQFNHPYQVLSYKGGGEFTVSANETGTTLTFTLNACANSTCSSGRHILATWVTGNLVAGPGPSAFTNTWNTDAGCQVQTTGSTGTLICHGTTHAALTSGGAVNTYNDSSTSAVTLDMTAQYYIGMMVQKSSTLDTGITQDVNSAEFKLF